MQWSDIRFNPTTKELRQFAALSLLIFGGLALWRFARGDRTMALVFGLLALGIGPLGLVDPRAIRPVYVGWMILAFPIGWMVSKLIIGFLYYGVITPVALVFRLVGRDVLRRHRRPPTATYWLPKPMPREITRYFRQF